MSYYDHYPPTRTDCDDPRIMVCQGPPVCDLQGDVAVEAQQMGCVWCCVITVHPDGTETVREPSRA